MITEGDQGIQDSDGTISRAVLGIRVLVMALTNSA